MISLSKLAIAALLVNVAACSSAEQPEAPTLAAEEPTAQDVANLAICGANTAASIATADGHRLTFCVSDHGREIIAEETSDGTRSVLPRRVPGSAPGIARRADECALDVFLAHSASDVPVPVALKASCELRRGHVVDVGSRKLSVDAVLSAMPQVEGLTTKTERLFVSEDGDGAKYCNVATGSAAFVTDFCSSLCTSFPGSPCSQACTPVNFTSSVRQCAETNIVDEDIVSCSGFTRVLVDVRDSSSDPFSNRLDRFLGPNRHMFIDVFELGFFGQDSDIRVRATSLPGAGHKHAFECIDL